MINGFSEFTHDDLSASEQEAMVIISDRLRKNVGKNMARTNKRMCEILLKEYGLEVSGARMRKLINYIRNKCLITNLVASSKGYYVSNDPDEINKYIYSLRQRAHEILRVAKVMEDNNTVIEFEKKLYLETTPIIP
jgi:hypothetical protein